MQRFSLERPSGNHTILEHTMRLAMQVAIYIQGMNNKFSIRTLNAMLLLYSWAVWRLLLVGQGWLPSICWRCEGLGGVSLQSLIDWWVLDGMWLLKVFVWLVVCVCWDSAQLSLLSLVSAQEQDQSNPLQGCQPLQRRRGAILLLWCSPPSENSTKLL